MKEHIFDDPSSLSHEDSQPTFTRNNVECSAPKVQPTPDIEKKYVHRVYDAIAPHFSSTRFAKWPKVQSFLNSMPRGSLVLDAGCGNGKYLGLNPNCYYIGCDISSPLVNICADKGNEVLVADAVNLPYRSSYGDAAISIAVLHHLSTEQRRRRAVEELIRVVKRGGLVLITVWAREQEDDSLVRKWTPVSVKYEEEWIEAGSVVVPPVTTTASSLECIPEGQEYFVPWHLPYHRAEVGGGASADAVASGFARKDDKKSAVVYDRYYHVFTEGELERLVEGVDDAVVADKFFDKSNWCIILEKT
ncbi:hypothetical protein M569_14591 [Genlisea aurea]|uniref:Methyltransferase type 11 domain-containing protein n=1 Tax=Genlisea aurea TaxID=192259 RepID=S8DL04_9LAMI|nr:hypothetical protein M569_14591 [Genlisea aurea]